MSTQTATPELRQWIIEQARAGHAPQTVLESMMSSGWDEDVAMTTLEETLRSVLAEQQAQPRAALPEPALADTPTTLQVEGRTVRVLMSMHQPRVVVFGGFLDDDECDELIAQSRERVLRSQTVDNATGGSEVNPARTSDGMFFSRAESPLVARVESRIAALVNWPVENGEGLQVLRYRPGAEYLPHYDYFDPKQPGAPSILARGGQRVGTFLMYLNTPEAGGATTFPDVHLDILPAKGNAVFFSYDRPDPQTRSLHGGAPVVAGEKWVATKWLRERRFD